VGKRGDNDVLETNLFDLVVKIKKTQVKLKFNFNTILVVLIFPAND